MRNAEEKKELQDKIADMRFELNALEQAAEADSATQAHLDRLRQILGEKIAELQEAMTRHVAGMAESQEEFEKFISEANTNKAQLESLDSSTHCSCTRNIVDGQQLPLSCWSKPGGSCTPERKKAVEELPALESAMQQVNQIRTAEIPSLEATKTDLQTLISVVTAEKDSCW